ncbi:hypothetical protein GRI97_13415 [Altererythrobacter xixiisoli]|uniref:DOMON-like domain-containing protein n=1 Tax=Croceibacterium xixiisoli TaxID=1476466 RepID=A0A6I4TZ67_9SPHN|nr:DOMON-like domain-containing protein [Croceibacterium xixiisoli]MXO99987.1 hypothetical protein [Croceibacterium xixiisoli]
MQTYQLQSHPGFPPAAIKTIEARIIGADADWLRVRWRIEGSDRLVVPPFGGKGRADGLWQTTCFELFLRPEGGGGYCEFNLSPSERWNIYDLDGYRAGLRERPAPREPQCSMRLGSSFAIFDAAIPMAAVPSGISAMGLCAVMEERGGVKSYWALQHPQAEPDFHDPACFAAQLAPPA